MALNRKNFPYLGYGLGLRTKHYADVLNPDFLSKKRASPIEWFEVNPENYMGLQSTGGRGRPFLILEKVREHFPIVFHGVSLSIGSVDPLRMDYLENLKRLIQDLRPAFVSDHICWASAQGQHLHDLLPLPYTEEAIEHVVERVQRVQNFLGRQILLENVSSYVEFSVSQMPEWEFLNEVARRADCGILLDINNIFVSSFNHQFDPKDYIRGISPNRVGQIHLAGHSVHENYLVDTHDHPVPDPVWELYRWSAERWQDVSVMIERDDEIPPLSVLEEELKIAKRLGHAQRFKQTRSQDVTARL